MPDQADRKRSRRFRLRLQFSLQTLLIVTLAAALFCAWWFTPRLEEKTAGGGAMKVRAQWAPPKPIPADANLPPASAEPYLHGRWILYDRQGRRLVDGRFADGNAAGQWRDFDAEGRETSSGTAKGNLVDGQWTTRHTSGAFSQQVSLTQRQFEYTLVNVPINVNDPSAGVFPPTPWGSPMPERTGALRQHWDNGQRRVTGQFAANQRDGKWTWFDREGKKVAEGTYRRGRKQGPWRRWETPGGRPVVEYFAAGKRVDDLDALLAEFATDLRSGEVRRRRLAAGQLERLGSAAVPVLREILREGDCPQRLLAIRALQHIGPDAAAAAEELEIAAGDERPRVKLHAHLALSETNPGRAEKAVKQLLALATNDDYEHRDLALDCLTRAGPAGVRQLVTVVEGNRQKSRLAAFETIMRMHNARQWCEPAQGDPNVDVGQLADVIKSAQNHPDPKIRELAGPPDPPSVSGGGMF